MEANLLRQFISTSPAELLIASIWQGLLLTAFGLGGAQARFRIACLHSLYAVVDCFHPGGFIALLCAWPRVLRRSPASPPPPCTRQTFSLRLNIAWAFVIEGLWVLASLFSLTRLSASAQADENAVAEFHPSSLP